MFIKKKSIMGNKSEGVVVTGEIINIDTMSDLTRAKKIIKS